MTRANVAGQGRSPRVIKWFPPSVLSFYARKYEMAREKVCSNVAFILTSVQARGVVDDCKLSQITQMFLADPEMGTYN